MLVLTRRVSQQILLGSSIRVTVVRIDGNKVRLGIGAPPSVPVYRQELCEEPRPADSLGRTEADPLLV